MESPLTSYEKTQSFLLSICLVAPMSVIHNNIMYIRMLRVLYNIIIILSDIFFIFWIFQLLLISPFTISFE